MGSSYDACYPAIVELARAGVPAVQVDAAELLHFRSAILRPGTTLLVVSQSGESAETVRLVRDLVARPGRGRLIGVTNGPGNTLAALADVALDTRAGEETGPSTMTFAASLVRVGALARVLAGSDRALVMERPPRSRRRSPARSSGCSPTRPCQTGSAAGTRPRGP